MHVVSVTTVNIKKSYFEPTILRGPCQKDIVHPLHTCCIKRTLAHQRGEDSGYNKPSLKLDKRLVGIYLWITLNVSLVLDIQTFSTCLDGL